MGLGAGWETFGRDGGQVGRPARNLAPALNLIDGRWDERTAKNLDLERACDSDIRLQAVFPTCRCMGRSGHGWMDGNAGRVDTRTGPV